MSNTQRLSYSVFAVPISANKVMVVMYNDTKQYVQITCSDEQNKRKSHVQIK